MRLTTTKLSFILASLCALSAAGCDDGGDDGDNMGAAGTGSGGGGSGGPKASTLKLTDFEEGEKNGYFKNEAKGLEGAWFTYTDKSTGSMITPAEGMPFVSVQDTSRPAMNQSVGNMKGSGFTTWGAGMGVNLKTGTPPGKANLTGFTGIGFWAKAATGTGGVSVKVVDAPNAQVVNGGTCVESATLKCDASPEAPLAVTADWKYFELRFADFQTPSWRLTPAQGITMTEVIGVQFQVGKGTTFDFSIDEFGLLTE